jgi:isocitrate dehydrogenase kinase/phosphatase
VVVSPNVPAARGAATIERGFDAFTSRFTEITRRARQRFERREWSAGQLDAVERIQLYEQVVREVVPQVRRILGDRLPDRTVWAEMKSAYARSFASRDDAELGATFFNSITRRILATVGVDPSIEFIHADHGPPASPAAPLPHVTYAATSGTAELVARILGNLPFAASFQDLAWDAGQAAAAIDRDLGRRPGPSAIQAAEMLPTVFYRNKGAYLVGRLRAGGEAVPLVLALLNPGPGVAVDAVLLTSEEASIVFGFTRAYFHVDSDRPAGIVEFLASLMPLKHVDELYTAIGYKKHGKTELYRELRRHLERPDARFEPAEGEKGLVMSVFALPTFGVVFKVIKDHFGPSKTATRRTVLDRYLLVFARDRVGRLADAQEFEHLEFPKERFAGEVLGELLREAPSTVAVQGNRVIMQHCYTERQVTPLNLYLKRADPAAARDAVLDYGNAIKDLAAANIFPGDILLKNFGVTRHGRVIFYDYDELCLLTECNFRALPQPRTPEDEFAAEPWFYVADRDMFPEEFLPFMLPPGPLRDAFLSAHRDLLTVEFWTDMQARQEAGEVLDFLPYRPDRRLRRRA